MLLLRHPNDDFIHATVDSQRRSALTYSEIGWTVRTQCPDGFAPNRWTAVIGNGEQAFERAKGAMQLYRMLQLSWMQLLAPMDPIAEGSIICTLGRQFNIYSLNVARIVYVDDTVTTRFGFAYGTTSEYPIIGEERLTVAIDEKTGDVTYDIFSFSRPSSFVLWLALPCLRHMQRRFCRESSAMMRAACQPERAKQ
jgi:uncharacterized protein (UPF0548 family)